MKIIMISTIIVVIASIISVVFMALDFRPALFLIPGILACVAGVFAVFAKNPNTSNKN